MNLSWKIAQGVLCTAERLHGFGYAMSLYSFCGFPLESLDHLFISCPLAQSGLSWIQSLLFPAAPRTPLINIKDVLFQFSCDDFWTFQRVFTYLIGVCKLGVWCQQNDFRFGESALCFPSERGYAFTCPFSPHISPLPKHVTFLIANWVGTV